MIKYLIVFLLIATPVMAQVGDKDQQIADLQLQLLSQQLNALKLKGDIEQAVKAKEDADKIIIDDLKAQVAQVAAKAKEEEDTRVRLQQLLTVAPATTE